MAHALAAPAIEAASQIVVPFDLFLPTNI
jgi:hypothetical protein